MPTKAGRIQFKDVRQGRTFYRVQYKAALDEVTGKVAMKSLGIHRIAVLGIPEKWLAWHGVFWYFNVTANYFPGRYKSGIINLSRLLAASSKKSIALSWGAEEDVFVTMKAAQKFEKQLLASDPTISALTRAVWPIEPGSVRSGSYSSLTIEKQAIVKKIAKDVGVFSNTMISTLDPLKEEPPQFEIFEHQKAALGMLRRAPSPYFLEMMSACTVNVDKGLELKGVAFHKGLSVTEKALILNQLVMKNEYKFDSNIPMAGKKRYIARTEVRFDIEETPEQRRLATTSDSVFQNPQLLKSLPNMEDIRAALKIAIADPNTKYIEIDSIPKDPLAVNMQLKDFGDLGTSFEDLALKFKFLFEADAELKMSSSITRINLFAWVSLSMTTHNFKLTTEQAEHFGISGL